MRWTLCVVLCVGVARPAWAQDTAPLSAPPVLRAQDDTTVALTEDDRLLFGEERREVTPLELFAALGRFDLVERGHDNARRRVALGVSAGVLAVIGLTAGIALLATSPDVTTGRCNVDTSYYNQVCAPTKGAHDVGGISFIAGGLLVAGVLATVAWWSRPEVFTRYELKKFIEEHNLQVGGVPVTLKLAPAVGPGFEGLVARGTF